MIHEIKLLPSQFTLDVYKGSLKGIPKAFSKKYGGKKSSYLDLTEPGYDAFVVDIHSTKDSTIGVDTRIVLVLDENNYSDVLLVHELIHVLWHYARIVGLNMSYESQEWQAITFEYLFEEVSKLYK